MNTAKTYAELNAKERKALIGKIVLHQVREGVTETLVIKKFGPKIIRFEYHSKFTGKIEGGDYGTNGSFGQQVPNVIGTAL